MSIIRPPERRATFTTDIDRPLAWFRFDASFVHDARVRTLPHSAQVHYVLALCATAQRIAPCTDARFQYWTRERLSTLRASKRRLLAAATCPTSAEN